MKNFEDIINLPHHRSKKRKPMPLKDRAVQFAPFSALTGHEAAIKETARLTKKKMELSEAELEELNEKIAVIKESLCDMPKISVTFFVSDEKKPGGAYENHTGHLRAINEAFRLLIFKDGTEIDMDNVAYIKYDEEL